MAAELYEKFAQGLGDESDLDSLIAIEQSEQVAFERIDAALLGHEEDDPQENVKRYTAMFKMLLERGFRPSYAYYKYLDMQDWDDLSEFYNLLNEHHLPIPAEYLVASLRLFMELEWYEADSLLENFRCMLNLRVPTSPAAMSLAFQILKKAHVTEWAGCSLQESVAVVQALVDMMLEAGHQQKRSQRAHRSMCDYLCSNLDFGSHYVQDLCQAHCNLVPGLVEELREGLQCTPMVGCQTLKSPFRRVVLPVHRYLRKQAAMCLPKY